jgi:uncharacterized protein (DUF58 family)
MRSPIKLRSRIVIYLVGLLGFLQLVDPSPIWSALLIALGGAWLIGYIWARNLAATLHIVREMRFGWAQVGDQLEERFTVVNDGFLPALWVEVIDLSDMPDYQVSRVSAVEGRSQNHWRTTGLCHRRGLFTLGPTRLLTADPFGFYQVEILNPASTSLMVTPPIVPLPAIEIAPGGRSGEGRPRPNAPEPTVAAASVRQYLPGDSLRQIHWRTSARLGSPYVRLFDGTPAGDWWIVLDMDQRAQLGEGWDSTVEHGIILAASIADRGLRLGQSVGLVISGRRLVWLPPLAGENHRWQIFQELTLAEPGSSPLKELLTRAGSTFSQRSSLVIITPDSSGDWIEPLLPIIWRGIIPTVLILNPATFGGTGNAQIVLSLLAELGIVRYVIDRELLDRPASRPGKAGQWEWRVSATGRAIPLRKPSEQGWKVLG